MELTTARQLIEGGLVKNSIQQTWADIGAGKGLFTRALTTMLAPGSMVYAVDADERALRQIASADDRVEISRRVLDFVRDSLDMTDLDGALMANALHYASDPVKVLRDIRNALKQQGRLIIIEYERTAGNQWVPFPVSYSRLGEICEAAGFGAPRKIGETPSAFQQGNIYSALTLPAGFGSA